MKVIDFAGYTHNWPPQTCIPDNEDTRPRSSLHLKCRKLLQELYPTRTLFEEVPLPGTQMSFDFVLLHRKICIEVQGQQHFENTSFFFNNKFEFAKAKNRDSTKHKWCDTNGLRLIELLYNETEEEWKNKILQIKN
jgi:hypothetical protein